MRQVDTIEGACPLCDHELTIERLAYVDAAKDRDVKSKLLEGSYFLEQCPHCSGTFTAATPMLYYDPAHHTLIQFAPGAPKDAQLLAADIEAALNVDEGSAPSRMKRRVVRDHNLFLEKLNLLEAGLDDRIVELMKAYYVQSNQAALPPVDQIQSVLYVPAENGGTAQMVFLYRGMEDMPAADFSRELYDVLGMHYFDQIEAIKDLEEVDLFWAIEFLKSNSEQSL